MILDKMLARMSLLRIFAKSLTEAIWATTVGITYGFLGLNMDEL